MANSKFNKAGAKMKKVFPLKQFTEDFCDGLRKKYNLRQEVIDYRPIIDTKLNRDQLMEYTIQFCEKMNLKVKPFEIHEIYRGTPYIAPIELHFQLEELEAAQKRLLANQICMVLIAISVIISFYFLTQLNLFTSTAFTGLGAGILVFMRSNKGKNSISKGNS